MHDCLWDQSNGQGLGVGQPAKLSEARTQTAIYLLRVVCGVCVRLVVPMPTPGRISLNAMAKTVAGKPEIASQCKFIIN